MIAIFMPPKNSAQFGPGVNWAPKGSTNTSKPASGIVLLILCFCSLFYENTVCIVIFQWRYLFYFKYMLEVQIMIIELLFYVI